MNIIPEGFKLVPVEPTEEMRLAFSEQIRTGDYNPGTLGGDLCAGVYTAMLAAAPAPPHPIYDEAKERELFNSWYGGLPTTKLKETMWMAWEACAQSRAKAGEDE